MTPKQDPKPPTAEIILECAIITPFGNPVEPEVYIIQARSSGTGAEGS